MKNINNFGFLFDLDGTLVNSLQDIAGVVNWVRESEGLVPLPGDVVRSHVGKGAENLLRGCFPGHSDVDRIRLLLAFNERYLTTPSSGGELYPGVAEGLLRLKMGGGRIAIVTNKPTLAAKRTLEHYLPGFEFEEVAGPETVSRRKPHPAHLTEVIQRLGLDLQNCCFVGDDPVDAECAASAGVAFFGACYGFGNVEVPEPQRLECFEDLLAKLC
jgi:2-phosphoglycolate phosphatase